jgi:uncharacterized lipoprotein NlpE involved in copper resistance
MKSLLVLISAIALTLIGCTNKFDECVENQKVEYRARVPNASFGQVQSKQAEFEMMCSSFKGK